MSVNGVTSEVAGAYTASTTTASRNTSAKESTSVSTKAEDTGVVYEPSNNATESDTSKTSDYSSIISNMKLELNSKNTQLQNLVTQLLGKQANKYSTSLADLFKNIQADSATIAQAKEDVSENGYWGVEQTSERLVSMAKALSGGDSTKADELISAIKKGYEQATKSWGDDLPDICKQTIDAATEKLTKWRDGLDTDTTAE
jgi:type VI protein secretion system component VasK